MNSLVLKAQPGRPFAWALMALILKLLFLSAYAGPPFVTDDPVPVDLHHWEYYADIQFIHDSGGWSGTMPSMEFNYGALPDLQLHLLASVAFAAPTASSTQFGLGDTELGFKYRFVHESKFLPQIAVFPALEVPTGSRLRGLGSGHLDGVLPVWMQKSFGKWTVDAGGAYWINPGEGNRNWCMLGGVIQRQVTEHLALGAEIFHQSAQDTASSSETMLNAGAIWDLTEHYHLLLSAGHSIQGNSQTIGYGGIQITF